VDKLFQELRSTKALQRRIEKAILVDKWLDEIGKGGIY
jgi:hypothetical protein